MKYDIEKFGFWSVNNKKFYNKIDAFIYASNNSDFKIDFHYHDQIWDSYDRNLVGSFNLKILYKERAQQIREKYDYLILNYSGGADSHNVLLSFLDNNIKLDAVHVKWPFKATDHHSKLFNNSPVNLLSEWDLTISKRLKWLSSNYPDVRIITDDWSEKILENNSIDSEKLYSFTHLYSLGDISRITTRSDFEIKSLDKNKTVGIIWGIDKPEVFLDSENNLYFRFRDLPINVAQPLDLNVNGTELFYWSPEFPQIVFEQSNRVLNFLKNNQEYFRLMSDDNSKLDLPAYKIKYKMQSDLVKSIIYDNWDPLLFQANKDFSPCKLQWDYWIYTSNELSSIVSKWKHSFNELVSGIDQTLTLNYKEETLGLQYCSTKKFFVGKI
jgi:hypothetical protein